MQIKFNVVQFSELSDKAKKIAKDNISDFLYNVLSMNISEIEGSKNAFIVAYNNESLESLCKNDYSLTGVCYDYDFMQINLNSDSVLNEVNKVFMALKKLEKRYVFSDEYVAELCEGNEILFLENGNEFKTIEKLLKV